MDWIFGFEKVGSAGSEKKQNQTADARSCAQTFWGSKAMGSTKKLQSKNCSFVQKKTRRRNKADSITRYRIRMA